MTRRTTQEGAFAALAAFGLKHAAGPSQPSLGSVGIKAPTSAPGLPSVAKAPTVPKPPMPAGISAPTSLGVAAAKAAALTPTHPVVRQSAVLGARPAKPAPAPQPSALTPAEASRNFAARAQEESRTEPLRKLSAAICTSCRRDKHYGTCKRPIPIKRANFNMKMRGEDQTGGNQPATSENYTSATTSVSPTTRTQEGRPPLEQASTMFRDLVRAGDRAMADEMKLSAMLDAIRREVGHTVNGEVDTAWRAFDAQSDATSIEGTGAPDGEPA